MNLNPDPMNLNPDPDVLNPDPVNLNPDSQPWLMSIVEMEKVDGNGRDTKT